MLYQDKFQEMPILCLSCANTFDFSSKERLECPFCSNVISKSQYQDLFRYSFFSIRYGYEYRKTIAKEISKNKKPRHFYLLPPEQILIYLGLAAVSGIVGNLATDLVKKVMLLIIERNRSDDGNDSELEIDIDELYQSIEIHFNNYSGLDENLIDEIEEEMLADTSADYPQYVDTIIKINMKKHKTKKDRRLIDKKTKQLRSKLNENILRKPTVNRKPTFWDNI